MTFFCNSKKPVPRFNWTREKLYVSKRDPDRDHQRHGRVVVAQNYHEEWWRDGQSVYDQAHRKEGAIVDTSSTNRPIVSWWYYGPILKYGTPPQILDQSYHHDDIYIRSMGLSPRMSWRPRWSACVGVTSRVPLWVSLSASPSNLRIDSTNRGFRTFRLRLKLEAPPRAPPGTGPSFDWVH